MVSRHRVGGCVGSYLHDLLQDRAVRIVVFTGVAPNASVEGTARGAGDLGHRTVVVEDALLAATLAARQASIDSSGFLAEITTAADVTAALT